MFLEKGHTCLYKVEEVFNSAALFGVLGNGRQKQKGELEDKTLRWVIKTQGAAHFQVYVLGSKG